MAARGEEAVEAANGEEVVEAAREEEVMVEKNAEVAQEQGMGQAERAEEEEARTAEEVEGGVEDPQGNHLPILELVHGGQPWV